MASDRFELDVPTSQEDIRALRRSRATGPGDFASRLEELARLSRDWPRTIDRSTARGREPFEL